MPTLTLKLWTNRYALARLPRGSAAPTWVEGEFTAIIGSPRGFTACCPENAVPPEIQAQRGFRCFEIVGPFELASVGVVASVAIPLREAGISLFLFSTWETDFVLVPADDLEAAVAALEAAGHSVLAPPVASPPVQSPDP